MVTAEQTPTQDVLPASTPSVPAVRPPAPAAKHRPRYWLWSTAGLVGLALAALVYSQFWMARPPVVAVEVAAFAPATRVLAVNGRIAAVNSVDIRAVVSGLLTALPVTEGDVVAQGEVLARADPAAQNAIVRQAMAGLDAALVSQQQARETYDRAVSLGANIPTSTLEANAHALQSAAQDVARQSAALDQARVVLDNHTLRAPIAGTVMALEAELGQLVGPSTPLLTLADLNDLVVEADVDEAYATQITVGLPVVLQLTGEARTRAGHISFVSTRVDVATGGLAVEVAFDAPVAAPIGLTVALNIIAEQRASALTVPRTALLADGTGVLIAQDGTAQRRALTVVEWPAARLIVTEGLSEGDIVIVDAIAVEDGQAITVAQP